MRCSLRREEIRAILSSHFHCDVEDFAIAPASPSWVGQQARVAVFKADDKENFIPNIRAIRNLAVKLGITITLAEGRWIIQNWRQFISFVDEYNRFPLSGYGSGENTGKLQ